MNTQRLTLCVLVLVVPLALQAEAAIGLELDAVDNSDALAGFQTTDVLFDSPISDWTSSALRLELTEGSIYQNPMGGNGPTSSGFFSFDPALEFDTYVGFAGGGIAGGAGDLGGDGFEFSTTALSVTFYNTADADIGEIPIGRITLSDDAAGDWRLLTLTANGHRFSHAGRIMGGMMTLDSELIQAPTLAAMSLVNRGDGAVLLSEAVTDAIRASAGGGIPGEPGYEYAVGFALSTMLIDEMQIIGSPELYQNTRFTNHFEQHTYTESEYLRLIDTVQTGQVNPEPGTAVMLMLGGLALLRRCY